MNFYEWSMANGYNDNLSIDRIDFNKGYAPSNCRWADKFQQANNRSNNRFIELDGEKHTIADWERITGIKYRCIQKRLMSGWSPEEILGKRARK